MPENTYSFRTALGGFHRGDVSEYIASAAAAHQARIDELQEQIQRLERENESLRSRLETLPEENPVTPTMVTEYITDKTGEPEVKVRKTVNVNLARLEKDGVLSRIAHGVYARRIRTPSGLMYPGKTESLEDGWFWTVILLSDMKRGCP